MAGLDNGVGSGVGNGDIVARFWGKLGVPTERLSRYGLPMAVTQDAAGKIEGIASTLARVYLGNSPAGRDVVQGLDGISRTIGVPPVGKTVSDVLGDPGVASIAAKVEAVGAAVVSSAGMVDGASLGTALQGQHVGGDPLAMTLWDCIAKAGGFAERMHLQGAIRMSTAPHFIGSVVLPYLAATNDTVDLYSLNPADKLSGETDVEFLNRVIPDITWSVDPDNGGVYGNMLSGSGGYVTLRYAPIYPDFPGAGFSLDDFKALWKYTPSSGPPERDGIADSVMLLGLVPVQYG